MLAGVRDRVVAEHGETADAQTALEHQAVRLSLDNLRTFPFVQRREAAGLLSLQGAWFGVAQGELHILDAASGAFAPA